MPVLIKLGLAMSKSPPGNAVFALACCLHPGRLGHVGSLGSSLNIDASIFFRPQKQQNQEAMDLLEKVIRCSPDGTPGAAPSPACSCLFCFLPLKEKEMDWKKRPGGVSGCSVRNAMACCSLFCPSSSASFSSSPSPDSRWWEGGGVLQAGTTPSVSSLRL